MKVDFGRGGGQVASSKLLWSFYSLIGKKKKKGEKVKPLAVAHKLREAEGKCQCYVTTLASTRQLLNRDVKGLFGIMYPPFHKLQLS